MNLQIDYWRVGNRELGNQRNYSMLLTVIDCVIDFHSIFEIINFPYFSFRLAVFRMKHSEVDGTCIFISICDVVAIFSAVTE